jgi:hypothetical protein
MQEEQPRQKSKLLWFFEEMVPTSITGVLISIAFMTASAYGPGWMRNWVRDVAGSQVFLFTSIGFLVFSLAILSIVALLHTRDDKPSSNAEA